MAENKGRNNITDDLYDDDDEDTLKDRYLTFAIAKEDYGIEIRYVTEIIGLQAITEVPDMPEFIKGVINLRGQVIPVMDVRARFKLPQIDYHDRTCIVVVDIDGKAVGLVVDKVNEVAVIPEDQVEPPPNTGKTGSSRYIQGLGKIEEEVKILLDINCLLYEEELAQLEGASGA